MIKIHREAKSRLSVPVHTSEDPAVATVSFSFPPRGDRPSTWIGGAWAAPAEFDEKNDVWIREALTPRIGDVALDLAAGHYRFLGKLVNGSDEDVWEIDDEGLEVL